MVTKSSILDSNAYSSESEALLDKETVALIHRREQAMGSSYRLFYKKPIHIVKGKGTYLWDDKGNKYLDMYNNVVGVGHCNQQVIAAVTKQMETLNTHTRYLHEKIIDYSEELLSYFPEYIDRAMFMCSGSEANDLAIRIAQAYTGRKGIIVTQEAYHGNTALVSGCSPSLGVAQPLGDFVRTVPTPDYYRIGGTEEEFTEWFAAEVQKAINDLREKGVGFAALLVDSIFSSDGVHPYPKGFMKRIEEVVHANGGLYIADEVQPGFARTGEAFWGYARHGVAPDLVTMGKPMGNGIPISGIAGRHEIMEAFSNKLPYFNTFGGNPVSIAAAQAVLHYIKDNDIQRNCQVVGEAFLHALKDVQSRHPDSVGDVRGAGLFIGFELVKNDGQKQPDKEKALNLIEALRDNYVLSSVAGPFGNILKIRPPMVFSLHDVDWAASTIDKCLTELER